MNIEKIHILIVDDNAPAGMADDWEGRFQQTSIKHYSKALTKLIDGSVEHPDIFLVDLNFESVGDREGAKNWGQPSGNTLVPYGPLLVLPFIHPGRTSVFVPYSSHWGDASLLENGFVLLSLALFQTSTTGEVWTIPDVVERLKPISDSARRRLRHDVEARALPTFSDFDDAIEYALPRYRYRLSTTGPHSIDGFDEAQLAVSEVSPGSERLCDASGSPIYITIRQSSGVERHVELEGLFLDIIKSDPAWGPDELKELREELLAMRRRLLKSGKLVARPEWEHLEEIRKRLVEGEGLHLKRDLEKFKKAFDKLYIDKNSLPAPNSWALMCTRFVVCMAFLRGWERVSARRRDSDGELLNERSWANWVPSGKTEGPDEIEERSIELLFGKSDERALGTKRQDITRILAESKSVWASTDDGSALEIWRTPFVRGESYRKRYMLSTTDSRIRLLPADRDLLQKFADDEFDLLPEQLPWWVSSA